MPCAVGAVQQKETLSAVVIELGRRYKLGMFTPSRRLLLGLLLLTGCGSTPADSVGESTPDAAPDLGSDTGTADVPLPEDALPEDSAPQDTAQVDTGAEDTAPEDAEPAAAIDTEDVSLPDAEPDAAIDVILVDAEEDIPDAPGEDTPTADTFDPERRCEPPIRMSPTSGPAAGGTRVEIFGEDWYIGALFWLATFDEVVVDEIYDGEPRPACTLIFETPPHPAGDVPVSVNYGSRPIEGGEPFGTFTYE